MYSYIDMDPRRIFELAEQKEPASDLLVSILGVIEEKKKRSIRFRMYSSAVLATLSGIALVPAGLMLAREAAQSGFWQFLSLSFSDSATVFANWKIFILSLLESVPLIGGAAVLASLFCLLALFRAVAKYSAEYSNSGRRLKYKF